MAKNREAKFEEAFTETAKTLKQQATIERILHQIGIHPANTRTDVYNRWKRFLEFLRDNSGKPWREEVRLKLRSWIGIDFRYIDDYFECCRAWGIVELNAGNVIFKGEVHESQKTE